MQTVIQFFASIHATLLQTIQTYAPTATSTSVDIILGIVAISIVLLVIEIVATTKANSKIEDENLVPASQVDDSVQHALAMRHIEELQDRTKEHKLAFDKGYQSARNEAASSQKHYQRELAVYRIVETLAAKNTDAEFAPLKEQAELIVDNMKIGL